MKKLFATILALSLIFSLCGCSLWYEYINDAIGSFDIGYNERLNEAFLAYYNWNGDEDGMNIVTPDNYKGAAIIGLGGYTGKGFPSPFNIMPSNKAKMQLCPNATEWYYVSDTADIDNTEVQYLRFKLHIGAQIKEIENLSMGGIVLASYEENGAEKYKIFVLTCYVSCDEDNKTFYAKDGKLYYRKDNVLVKDIVYDDFDIDTHNKTNKDSVGWRCPF